MLLLDCGFVPGFVNYKKGALDSQPQVIKFTSCLPMVGGSLRIIHFSDVTLLFKQSIMFNNLQFILLFLNIRTLTFYYFRLKNAIFIFWDFQVPNHCWAFKSLLWLSKLPSYHSSTVTIVLYFIISIFNAW